MRDEIEFLAFHSFLMEVQMNAGYIHAVLLMCDVNLQIRIAGFRLRSPAITKHCVSRM